jgi:tRNA A37 N6-isopentenylltransferase MiaA
MIWYTTGTKPSLQKPFWSPIVANITLIWLYREKKDLYDRIDNRLAHMLCAGWYDEVCGLDDAWKDFVHKKKLCGYNILVDLWEQKKMAVDDCSREKIKKETVAYAKRQEVFWKSLKKKCAPYYQEKNIDMYEFNLTFHSIDLYLEQIVINKGF